MRSGHTLLALLAAFVLEASAEDTAWEFSGFYKNLLSLTDVRDNYRELGLIDRDVQIDDIQGVRLQVEYTPASWTDLTLHYELRAVWGDSIRIRRRLESVEEELLSPLLVIQDSRRARFLDIEDELVEESAFTLEHGLDRLYWRLRWGRIDFVLGRQAVSWGSGLVWNPTDLFTGFAPNEIDRDHKLGIDVARLTVAPTFDISIDLVVEPLDREETWNSDCDDSSAGLRITSHLGEYDFALVGGVVEGDRVAGGDFSGYLGNAGFRGEGLYAWVDEENERDYFRGLLSLDYSIKALCDPYVALEYLFNGLGEGDEDDYLVRRADESVRRAFERGTAFNIGRDYLAGVLRLIPSTLVQVQGTTLWNLNDGSLLEFATLAWSITDNADLIFGANVGLGSLGTEFGGISEDQATASGEPAGVDFRNPDFYYAYLKTYF